MLRKFFLLSSTNRFILIVTLIVVLLGVTTLLYLKSQNFQLNSNSGQKFVNVVEPHLIDSARNEIFEAQKNMRWFVESQQDSSLEYLAQHINGFESNITKITDNYLKSPLKQEMISTFNFDWHFKRYENEMVQLDSLMKALISLRKNQKSIQFSERQNILTHKILNKLHDLFHITDVLFEWNYRLYEIHVDSQRYDFIHSMEQFKVTARGMIMVIFVLCFIVIVNIKKLYSDERKIIEYGKTVEQYADHNREFLANMSHELRTPINSIIGYSEQMHQTQLDHNQKDFLDCILSASDMLLGTVNDILDFSKFETDKVVLVNQTFSPLKLVNEVLATIYIQAQKKNIQITLVSELTDNLLLEADAFRVKQVILNLVSNAVKYTPEGGKVWVRIKTAAITDQKVNFYCEVEDTGIGIAPEYQLKVFDKFAQINSKENSEWQNGTGLGLAICKKIVELMQGEIALKSELDKGSTFSFEMPLSISTHKPHHQTRKQSNQVFDFESLSKVRVLFVDDNDMNVKLGSMILKKFSIQFETAQNGKDAFEKYLLQDFDIIVSDIQMPVWNGVELTQNIRALNKPKNEVQILGLTANVLQDDIKIYLKAGMNQVITKPYTEHLLIQTIQSMVGIV